LIINGSARVDGNAGSITSLLVARTGDHARRIDLASVALRSFAYDKIDRDDDDFRAIIDHMIESREIVLVTPVYWYAMSGTMKTFFDRLTDVLLDPILRPAGRRLAGKHLHLVAIGNDPALPDGFEVPVAQTAAYFKMEWRGSLYIRLGDDWPLDSASLDAIEAFAGRLAAKT